MEYKLFLMRITCVNDSALSSCVGGGYRIFIEFILFKEGREGGRGVRGFGVSFFWVLRTTGLLIVG